MRGCSCSAAFLLDFMTFDIAHGPFRLRVVSWQPLVPVRTFSDVADKDGTYLHPVPLGDPGFFPLLSAAAGRAECRTVGAKHCDLVCRSFWIALEHVFSLFVGCTCRGLQKCCFSWASKNSQGFLRCNWVCRHSAVPEHVSVPCTGLNRVWQILTVRSNTKNSFPLS